VPDDALIGRIASRLLSEPEVVGDPFGLEPDWVPDVPFHDPPVPAAVLIALLRRPSDWTVLYTARSGGLRAHSGQVAFPGGKIDPTDTGPGQAALREAREEVDLDPAEATIIGYMPPYRTGTNYLITPVVATAVPTRPFVANPAEVDAAFEVPLGWLVDESNYGTFRIMRDGVEHTTWELHHGGFRIWGITANLTRKFRDRALAGETPW
jgi:8-oxo-dGTP pyrophosphatase MutT (NUDIX family)